MDPKQMIDSINALKGHLELLERDTTTLIGGRKASAPTARKTACELTRECKVIRGHILAYQRGLPVAKRKPKVATSEGLPIDVVAETAKAVAEMPALVVPDIDVSDKKPRKKRTTMPKKNIINKAVV